MTATVNEMTLDGGGAELKLAIVERLLVEVLLLEIGKLGNMLLWKSEWK